MAQFNYEWWTVDITDESGTCTWIFKGRNRQTITKQIEKCVRETNSEKNASMPVWYRKPKILAVHWDTFKIDHVGYNRLY